MKRIEIYKKFQQYVQQKDERPMDEICKQDGFKLQAQQLFLREYMKVYPDWRSLLLYHEIGSGKTCTAITMAEEYLATNPTHKVKVILPARLRTNFIDELMSPCANKLKAKIPDQYTIMSFEKFKINAMKAKPDIAAWLKDFSRDSLIIVDEVHNLLSDKYDRKKSIEIFKTGQMKRSIKGMNTVLFRLLTKFADSSAKILILTATPIFDNINQMRELVYAMDPSLKNIPDKAKIRDVINNLRGKVSYFPGTSINAYPTVSYKTHEIPFSETQEELTLLILQQNGEDKDDDEEELGEQFMIKQRQVSVAVYHDIAKSLSNMPEYCPKILDLLHTITNNPGKHVVFSNFIKHGLHIIQAALEREGWTQFPSITPFKTYALWDGSIKDAQKQAIKNKANAKDNIFGENIRVILGSPSIKEGVSFKHVQHIHLLDPVWNQSAKAQVEGRAIRYCSHVDIDPKVHAPLKRAVTVHLYKSMPRPKGILPITCDQRIYDFIIEEKKRMVQAGESALKKVAIDHYLFRDMYAPEGTIHKPPKSTSNSAALSSIGIPSQDNILLKHKPAKNKKANTCPKKRRPDRAGNCPEPNQIVKKNKQRFLCCYKETKAKTKTGNKTSTCPAKRRPNDQGECVNPDFPKKKVNKYGDPCCYKK
jgi:hypothetical protein